MKAPIEKTISFKEYSDKYIGKFKNYYQVHIFSLPEITSFYFNPKEYKLEEVKPFAVDLLNKIKKHSQNVSDITLFGNDSKYIISTHTVFFDPGEIFEFYPDQFKYDITDDEIDFMDFLGNIKVDVFIKKALISVGAEELVEVIEPHINKLCEIQNRNFERDKELLELDKNNPLCKLEIYRIEKDYIPVKINEILCHSVESAINRQELISLEKFNKRVTFILRDIVTNKIIYGNLIDFIEGLKYEKWLKKNPLILDMDNTSQMELDPDNSNSWSYDDLTKENEDFEKGDDEYEPVF